MKALSSLVLTLKSTNTDYLISSRGGTVGRDHSCEVAIDDRQVSRINSELVHSDGVFFLSDKKSYNGTFLHFSPALGRVPLRNQVAFELDNFVLDVKDASQKPMKIRVYDQLKEVSFSELVDFEKSARFCFCEQGSKGFRLAGPEEKSFEIEFLKVKSQVYAQVPEKTTVE